MASSAAAAAAAAEATSREAGSGGALAAPRVERVERVASTGTADFGYDINSSSTAVTSTSSSLIQQNGRLPTRANLQQSSESVQLHRLNHNPSKLPAFRFADRDSLPLPVLQLQVGLLQSDQHPPLPDPAAAGVTLSTPEPTHNDSTPLLAERKDTSHTTHQQDVCPENHSSAASPPVPDSHPPNHQQGASSGSSPSPSEATSKFESPTRSRASTYQTASTSAPITPAAAKRPNSFPIDESTRADHSPALAPQSQTDADSPSFSTPVTRPRTRRADSSQSAISTSPTAIRDSPAVNSPGITAEKWAQRQRELSLQAKAVNGTLSDDKKAERRKSTSRPPVSYRPPPPAPSTPGRAVVPPIRSFRSSGSRKSLQLDMNNPAFHYYDDGDDPNDSNHRDQSLQALEGRSSNGWSRDTYDHTLETIESENTAEIFMSLAREDSSSDSRRRPDGRGEEQNGPVSRVVRTARQRPVSTVLASFQSHTASPRHSRRLSDQHDTTSRTRRKNEDQPQQYTNRDALSRSSTTEKPSLTLDSSRARSVVSSLRPSPITPRNQGAFDSSAEGSPVFARRPSMSDSPRPSSHRHPSGLSKSFNPSPLVPKNGETHHTAGPQHEASESSNSTAAPSTVWDELDELKSRIHRLELTGKLPRTSGAAMSRASDERPPTAGTGATTLSGSPKRASGPRVAQTEILSTTSSHRETQPMLKSALSKTKPFVSSDIYDAIEAAANDALTLSQMMGSVGQPGPISSGASTIGVGGPSTVTDRQLRKKADSVCRSLTELCLALTEDGSQRKAAVQGTSAQPREREREVAKAKEQEPQRSPQPVRVFTGVQPRESARPDEPVASVENEASPRVTRLEKRATFNFGGVNGTPGLPSPRYSPSVMGGGSSTPGRKSSLLVARTRRGLTEEPDDQGRKTSLLRTRRAGTEEADEGHRGSFLLPPRRVATNVERASNFDEAEPRFRVPSRAVTEVNALRVAVPRDDGTRGSMQFQEPSSAGSGPARRRLITSNLPTPGLHSSRLTTPTTPISRRLLSVERDRPMQQDRGDSNNMAERLAEDRGQRQYSVGRSSESVVGRSASIGRKRLSGIPSMSGSASNVGGYR